VNESIARKMRIEDAGGTSLPVGSLVDKMEIREANALAEAEGKSGCKAKKPRPATAKTLLLGITKASLQAESFLSGASFQETTKVLTEAALKGAVDHLLGLKENVLLGHLIPAGTGFEAYSKAKVKRLVDVPEYDDEAAAAMYDEAAMEAESLGAERRGSPVTTVRDRLASAIAAGQETVASGEADELIPL
jgi:DNA-directed RNA polymerase subunit beta'